MRKQIVFPGIKNAISWLKSMVGKLKGDIGLEQDTDNATQAISSGTYVVWKGDLYKANTAIASGASLSSGSGGNLTEISGGIGNELNDKLTTLGTYVDVDGSLTMTAQSTNREFVNPTIPAGYKITGVTLIVLDPNGWVNAQLIYNTYYNGWEVFGYNSYTAQSTLLYRVRFYIAKTT